MVAVPLTPAGGDDLARAPTGGTALLHGKGLKDHLGKFILFKAMLGIVEVGEFMGQCF